LNLTRVLRTAGPEPLVSPEVMMTWRLEALYLSQTTLNEQSVDSIATYLASPKSEILRELHVNQCGLTGHDLTTFFRSMTREQGPPRIMNFSANENRLKAGNTTMFRALGQNCGPSSLSLRMMDFEKESHFRELIDALKINKTLRSLDISRATLPYDASIETCEALKDMFATNQTLEELDISGEHAHLDATRFGIGLNIALRGLEKNRSLKLLRIEHQALGLQGASTLAEVLQKNDTLVEIHCEHNDINLQSFTALVNALEKNRTLLFMSSMEHDRAKTMEKVRREIEVMDRAESPKAPKHGPGSLRKAFTGSLSGKSHARGHSHRHSNSTSSTVSFTDQDLAAVLSTLDERWNLQVSRMQKFLFRNYCLAQGVPWEDGEKDESSRPPTMGGESSLAQILQQVKLDRTPTAIADAADPMDFLDEKLGRQSYSSDRMIFQMPEE
jgi:Ran GTPase-activating protein (RanGAP) involved in mRNA processing and transport